VVPTANSGVPSVLLMTILVRGAIAMMQLLLPCFALRWKEFSGDTSIEKAGLYFEGYEQGSSESIDGIASNIPKMESLDGWNLVDSLSELKFSEPGKREPIGDLW
jgi:hypothetical protein